MNLAGLHHPAFFDGTPPEGRGISPPLGMGGRAAAGVGCGLCLVLLAALAGCAGAPSPKTHYYALSVEAASAGPEQSTPAAPATRTAVTRVGIPGMVDRPQIVSRTATNSVEIFDFHRWAEPLQEAIPRVIAGDLARQLGPGHFVSAGILPGAPPAVRIAVDVQKFEATVGTGVAVEALWSVRPGTGEARTGRSAVEEPAAESGHAGIVAAFSRALAAVAQDIAAAVSALPVIRPAASRP